MTLGLLFQLGPLLSRARPQVEQAAVDVSRGQDALLSRLSSMSSNTSTALKVGGIVCATLVVYILII